MTVTSQEQWRCQERPSSQDPRGDGATNIGTMVYHANDAVFGDERTRFSSFDDYLADAQVDPDEVVALAVMCHPHHDERGTQTIIRAQDLPQDPSEDDDAEWTPDTPRCVGVIFAIRTAAQHALGCSSDEPIIERLMVEVEAFDAFRRAQPMVEVVLERRANPQAPWETHVVLGPVAQSSKAQHHALQGPGVPETARVQLATSSSLPRPGR